MLFSGVHTAYPRPASLYIPAHLINWMIYLGTAVKLRRWLFCKAKDGAKESHLTDYYI